MLTLKQVDDCIKDIFSDDLVKSVETVYQKSKDGYLLVISIHALEMEDTIILHTKFIFPVNGEKTGLRNNNFTYLTNLGCGYRYVEFEEDDSDDLKEKIDNILDNNDFDEELRDISDFLSQSPDSRINNYLHSKGIEQISCHEVKYNPKFKMSPCEDSSYDFTFNVNNTYDLEVSLEREDNNTKTSRFKMTSKFNDINVTYVDSMSNIGEVIAQEIINIFSKDDIIRESINSYTLKGKRNPNLVITFDVVNGRIQNIIKSIKSIRFPYKEGEPFRRNVEVWSKNNNYKFNGKDLSKDDKIMGIKKSDIPQGHPLRDIYRSKFR